MIRVRVENRSRSKQQRLSPLRKIRNVSREPHHAFIKSRQPKTTAPDCAPMHIQAARASHRLFNHSFDVLYIDPEPNLQFRTRMIGNHVWAACRR